MSPTAGRRQAPAHAFTLIELIAVIVILAVLGSIAIPKYFDYTANAKVAACKGVLGNSRTDIQTYYKSGIFNTGVGTFPSLITLQTVGMVITEPMPVNPYNNDNAISGATWTATPPVTGSSGWSYDEVSGHFWANSTTAGVNEHLW